MSSFIPIPAWAYALMVERGWVDADGNLTPAFYAWVKESTVSR